MHRHCRALCTACANHAVRLYPVFLLLPSRRETLFGRPRSAVATWRDRTFFAKWRQNFSALGPLFGADVPALPDLKAP